MKQVNQKLPQGRAGIFSKGRALKCGIVAIGLATCLTTLTPSARAITQLEFLQTMVQLTGDGASFSADSTATDFVQWARNRNMSPSDGWNPNSALTPTQLARMLVQLYNLESWKYGNDYFRILEREGISIDRNGTQVTRASLARLLDDFGMQNRLSRIAWCSSTGHGGGNHHPPHHNWWHWWNQHNNNHGGGNNGGGHHGGGGWGWHGHQGHHGRH